jgi:EpsD family peptidyl-prolyl cis-trans isomerase
MHHGHPSGRGQGSLHVRHWHFAAVALALLVACSPESKIAANYDEVVARVNGQEITVNHLNDRLAQLGLPAGGDAALRGRVLDVLIDERLLVQKALSEGLDRERMTQGAIERARLRLLAQAAIDASAGGPRISDKEARAFYHSNPDLFGKRRVYTFGRFLLEAGKLEGTVRAALESARDGAEVAGILARSRIPYTRGTEIRTAESLPELVLAQAAKMESGDILLYREGGRTVLLQLAGSIAEPIALDSAIPSIRDYLAESRRQAKAERLVKDLRRKAKIEYVTQTAGVARPTALADGKPLLDEPPMEKPLQTHQITVVR